MRVLALNSGSSSLKFAWADIGDASSDDAARPPIQVGVITGIGDRASFVSKGQGAASPPSRLIKDHGAAVEWVFEELRDVGVQAVGHRIVHGGARFTDPVKLDATVIAEIERLTELAPLHNPSALDGIRAARALAGDGIPMVAVFDTAFHASLPEEAARYALPSPLAARHGIRRYGFHGVAHASMARQYATLQPAGMRRPSRIITAQLGHGCSMTAVRDGRSMDTSMGFTPLEGLVMGTRSGDVDPSVIGYLMRREGLDVAGAERLLNEQSGLLGLSGLSGDMKVLLSAAEAGHSEARAAIRLFCYRAKKCLGAYLAALGGVEAVIFGGGIGERAPSIRAGICEGMEWCGLVLDRDANRAAEQVPAGTIIPIHEAGSSVSVYVAGVDEEWEILWTTRHCLVGTPPAR